MTRQRLSFWLVCISMLLEYVRPQAIYPFLATIPWARICLLAAPIAFFLEGGRLVRRTPIDTWMMVFGAAIVASWVFAQYPAASTEKMSVFINWVLVYILIANVATTELRFFLFFGLFLLASLKMSQHGARSWVERGFSFASWGATGAPGWFHNSGEFGIQMCIFFPLSLYFIGALKDYLANWKRIALLALPLTAVMSLIATNSRGALLGAAAVGIWMLARTRHRVRAFVGLGVLTALVVLVMPEEQKDRFRTMGDDDTSESRLTYWEHGIQAYKDHPLTGIGYENWAAYYEATYGRTALPHNIFIQAGAELGTVGFVALLGLIGASFVVTYRTRKIAHSMGERGRFIEMTARGLDGAMIGFLASAFFVTVLYYPYFWFALGITSALYAAALESARTAGRMTAPQPATVPVHGWRTASSAHRRETPGAPVLPNSGQQVRPADRGGAP